MGFEPTRAEPNELAVHRLNHSPPRRREKLRFVSSRSLPREMESGNKFCPKILRENMMILVIQVSYDYQDSVV